MLQEHSFPFYKLFIADLINSKYERNSNAGPNMMDWQLKLSNGHVLVIKCVWLQGVIENIENGSLLTLRDASGATCRVSASSAVQSSTTWLSKGAYCCVLGQLEQAGSDPKVFALKIMDLSAKQVLQQMWPLEVAELKKVISKRVAPSLRTPLII